MLENKASDLISDFGSRDYDLRPRCQMANASFGRKKREARNAFVSYNKSRAVWQIGLSRSL